MENKVAQILRQRSDYVRQLNRMKKQVQDHKEALRRSRAPLTKLKEADTLLRSIQESLPCRLMFPN